MKTPVLHDPATVEAVTDFGVVPTMIEGESHTSGVNGGAKRDHFGGVRRDRLAAAGLSP